jgi:hypothetical protein
LIGGAGATAPAFDCATLYRARLRVPGAWRSLFRGGRIIESSDDLAALAGLFGSKA